MPPTDVQELEKPAEVTGAESSPQPETSTAKEGDQPKLDAEKPKADALSDDEEPKPDKDNRAPFEWVKRLKGKTEKLTAELEEFKKFGIESPEHAEVLQRDAENFQHVLGQLRDKPESFKADLKREFPEAHEAIKQEMIAEDFSNDPIAFEKALFKVDEVAHSQMLGNALRRVLLREASDVKRDNPDAATYLENLASKIANTQAVRTEKQSPKPVQTRNEPADNERQSFYDEQVALDVNGRLTDKINNVLSERGVDFPRGDKQKAAFMDAVLENLTDTLYDDKVFVRELERIDDPRNGLNKSQRKASADHRFKYATMGNRLMKAVSDEIENRNLPVGKPKGLPPERREINAAGKAPSGALTQSDSDRIYQEQHAKGLRGSDLTAAVMAEKRKLRGAK